MLLKPVQICTADHKAETIERIVEAVKAFQAANANERIAFRLDEAEDRTMTRRTRAGGGRP